MKRKHNEELCQVSRYTFAQEQKHRIQNNLMEEFATVMDFSCIGPEPKVLTVAGQLPSRCP